MPIGDMSEYIGPLAGAGALAVSLLKELGIFDNIKDKLKIKAGDPEFTQISVALSKMLDFYSRINNGLSGLTKLSVDGVTAISSTKDVLQKRVISGELEKELTDGRLRCGQIRSIWYGDPGKNIPSLLKWFLSLKQDGTISQDEFNIVDVFFKAVSNSDNELVKVVKRVNESALDYARRIVSLIDSKDIRNAKIEIEKMVKDIENFQSQLNEASGRLQRTGGDLVEIGDDYAQREKIVRSNTLLHSSRKDESRLQKILSAFSKFRHKRSK